VDVGFAVLFMALLFLAPAGTQNQTSICCLRPGPSQMFELRISASLETNGLEPWEQMLRRTAD
jgi:hypothetical protein